MKRKITPDAMRAIYLGSVCSFAYLAVYVVRNILSAVSPQMLEFNVLTNEMLGTLSSIFFTTYAVGQLINGLIGDKLKVRYMMCGGLALAGIAGIAFAFFGHMPQIASVAYGATGFFLSMIYGPMTKNGG